MENLKRLPAHITEEDIRIITRIIFPAIAADAWDEGAEFFMKNIHGDLVDVSEYNPYRQETN